MMFVRTYFATSVFFSKSVNRESRFLNKILSRNTPKKHSKFVVTPLSPTSFPDRSIKVTSSRRVAVLNKLFMKYITDIISTGNLYETITSKGLEISKVAVTPDFQGINVFWYSPNVGSDEDMNEMLANAARQIRHELSQLRLMGYIPKISFVKDKKKTEIEELENLLSTLHLPDIEEEDEQKNEILNEHIPEMTSNVYGLDHDKIMKKILVAKGRQTDLYKKPSNNSECLSLDGEEEKRNI